jgi:hypothetical protein
MQRFSYVLRHPVRAIKRVPWRKATAAALASAGFGTDGVTLSKATGDSDSLSDQLLPNADQSQDAFLDSFAAAGGVIEQGAPTLSESVSPKKLRSLGVLWPDEIDRMCAEQQRVDFLVEDFLPPRSLAIAAGESTIGKSPLLCQLGLCVAAGVPFLGLVTRRARVLYFDLENSLRDGRTMRASIVKLLALERAPFDFLVATEPPGDLESLIKQVKPRLVMIDSLRAFRPEVTTKNALAGQWLKEIRHLARKYDCTFLIVHHLRKPNVEYPAPDLGECTVSNWLAEMEGPRAFVNQTDVRIAIAEGDREPTALKLKWSRRVHGDMPMVRLERVYGEDDPLGYRQLTGIGLLSKDRREVLDKLPNEFATGDARKALNRGDEATDNFLKECARLGLIDKVRRGRWKKLPQSNLLEKAENPGKPLLSNEIQLRDPVEKG